MGLVFAAYDEDLDRKVAIKLLRTDGPAGPLDKNWLLAEAKAMARLSHPNVVQIYDVGELEGQIFVAMELVTGASLRDWLRQERRTIPEITRVFVEAGRGLAAVHRRRRRPRPRPRLRPRPLPPRPRGQRRPRPWHRRPPQPRRDRRDLGDHPRRRTDHRRHARVHVPRAAPR
jgi:serine/threonine protein kinase